MFTRPTCCDATGRAHNYRETTLINALGPAQLPHCRTSVHRIGQPVRARTDLKILESDMPLAIRGREGGGVLRSRAHNTLLVVQPRVAGAWGCPVVPQQGMMC